MAKAMYEGVGGVARKVIKRYEGMSGVSRAITKGYYGVSGIARQYWQPQSINFYTRLQNGATDITTINDSFAGIENGKWRLYINATCTQWTSSGRAQAGVILSDYVVGANTITITYTASGQGAYRDNIVAFYNDDGDYFDYSSYQTLSNASSETTVTYRIPSDTTRIGIRSAYGAQGTGELEIIISGLTIDGHTFI